MAVVNPNVNLCGCTNIGTKARANHRGNDRRRDFAALARRRRRCRGPAVTPSPPSRLRDDDFCSGARVAFPAGPGHGVTCVRQLWLERKVKYYCAWHFYPFMTWLINLRQILGTIDTLIFQRILLYILYIYIYNSLTFRDWAI